MNEIKLGSIFEHKGYTLQCRKDKSYHGCEGCIFDSITIPLKCSESPTCGGKSRKDGEEVKYSNKLIFKADGIKLQVKRKGKKVAVKILGLYTSEDGLDYECAYFKGLEGENFSIQHSDYSLIIEGNELVVSPEQLKVSNAFTTEQDAIEWVHNLFSLGGKNEK